MKTRLWGSMIKTERTLRHNRYAFHDWKINSIGRKEFCGKLIFIQGQSTELNNKVFSVAVTTFPWQQLFLRVLFRSLHLLKKSCLRVFLILELFTIMV